MHVWNALDDLPADGGPVVATIGNYDGVHLGHQRILESMSADARSNGLPTLLLTFDPHPTTVVAPEHRPRLLTTRRQKLDLFEAAGLHNVLILAFDTGLAALTAEAFFELLLGRLDFAAVHVGGNFRFGRGREGDIDLLTRIGATRGFRVVGLEPVRVDGETLSSSVVRRAVEQGDVERAHRFLGRPFELVGRVGRGAGRGVSLGFPTANLAVENEMLPRPGVYVTEIAVLGEHHSSITNVGTRPTFGEGSLGVETHLLDFDGDLLDERAAVRFLTRLRDEARFDDKTALADQIGRDRAAALSYFENLQIRT